MNPPLRHISDLVLERYIADALDAETRSRVKALLARSSADSARLQELLADSAAFLQKHPPEALIARFRVRTAGRVDLSSLVATLTRMVFQEAQRPEAPYISDEFVELCLMSRHDPAHSLQHPGFNTQGDELVVGFITALEGLLSKVVSDPQRMFLLERLLRSLSAPQPVLPERSMVELLTELLGLIGKHPALPAELKDALLRVIEKLRS